jgi:hypothetical protein
MRFAAIVTACALLAAAGAEAALKKVTASGVGGVKLGMTYRQLRARHLVGPIRPGCELGGPNTRSAALRAPLRGSVDFTQTRVRKVIGIDVTKGAAANGVGLGATIAEIKAAFPHARVDHSTDTTFEFTEVRVRKVDGGPFVFAVDTGTHKATAIGVPDLAICD